MNSLFSRAVFKVIKSPAIRWQLKKSFPETFFSPHMKPVEFSLFKEICNDKKNILEYGSGGSTIYLLKNKKNVFSVESNPEFFEFMNLIPLVKRSIDNNLHFSFIDLGFTNKWGKPITPEKSNNWPAYYTDIWNKIDSYNNKLDVIFIDGRFRVSCCLYSILKIMQYNWKDTFLLIHDFWSRERYHIVLNFLQEIKSERNLACFKLRDKVDVNEVKEKLQEYALIID
jgi:hypothetical protein